MAKKFKGFAFYFIKKRRQGCNLAESRYFGSVDQAMSGDETHYVVLEHLNAIRQFLSPCDAI